MPPFDATDTAPSAATGSPATPADPLRSPDEDGAALFKLQAWLIELYRRQLAYQDEDGIICVVPKVAERFALGVKTNCAFVVMPDMEVEWATILPWSHAAMRRGKTTLFFVSEPMEIDGLETAAFGMSFAISERHRAMALQEHGELELRKYVSHEQQWRVSEDAFAVMPLLVLGEDEKVFEAGRKRNPSARRATGGRR